jgi:uncharacterized protein (TIGR02271 family)
MTQETIVAVFDTAAHAQAAVRDVEAAGVPSADITQHASDTMGQTSGSQTLSGSTLTTGNAMAPAREEPGFWGRLFGAGDETYTQDAASTRDRTVYDRTIGSGGAVVSIRLANVEQDGDRIMQILERHNPVDIEERAASYGIATETAGYNAPRTGAMNTDAMSTGAMNTGAMTGNDQTIQLAEEQLQVGKRIINRGTTRIRRYVVETPVEENVTLHNESVSIERRPVSGTGTIAQDAFTDKTIEVTEMSEEAVIGKTARVTEEVVVRKDVSDRVETVRDTVRREQVEVEKVDDANVRSVDSETGMKRPLGR